MFCSLCVFSEMSLLVILVKFFLVYFMIVSSMRSGCGAHTHVVCRPWLERGPRSVVKSIYERGRGMSTLPRKFLLGVRVRGVIVVSTGLTGETGICCFAGQSRASVFLL